MSDFTLMLLLDAFRPDYFVRTRFLRGLAGRSATGQLRECFGFVPRAAYFGGLSAEQFGFTNMFCYDPAHSPFRAAKSFAGRSPDEARTALNDAARKALPAYAAQYVSSFQIPLDQAAQFDVVEKRAPWDKQVGFRSLFHVLDERGIAWHQCAWPDTNQLTDRSDLGIVCAALAALRPEHRFAYVHLQELDAAGHQFGPNSAEMGAALRRTDAAVEQLVTELRARYESVNLLVFGDHGMVNVVGTVDVSAALESSGLKMGRDYVAFLDSTMARFWMLKKSARAAIERCLAGLRGGRLLDAEAMRHYGIAGCDKRNGELYFLADPGVLIVPNYFQSTAEGTLGMHGYDPDCPDNLGGFLLHLPGETEMGGLTLGKVDPASLYPTLLDLLGVGESAGSLRERMTATREPLFTRHSHPRADEVIASQLKIITESIISTIGEPEAILLTGSQGRGEGAVTVSDGEPRAYNDVDLIIVDGTHDHTAALHELSERLPRELGLDFVDLAYSDGRWAELPLTIFNYDLKYGSRMLFGDPAVLDRLPEYASADLPVEETVKLLLNRTMGVLSGLNERVMKAEPLAPSEEQYLLYQLVKAFIAIGDAYVVHWRGYDSSYAVRRDRFEWLAPGAGIPDHIISRVVWAYAAKLNPDTMAGVAALPLCSDLLPELQTALIRAVNTLTQSEENDVFGAMARYTEHAPDREQLGWDNAALLDHPALRADLRERVSASTSVRRSVYAAGPLLLSAAFNPAHERMLVDEAAWHLQSAFTVKGHTDWEAVRALAVRLWLGGIIH